MKAGSSVCESTEGSLGFEHPDGGPPFSHGTVTPALHVPGRGAHDGEHRLDPVCRHERAALRYNQVMRLRSQTRAAAVGALLLLLLFVGTTFLRCIQHTEEVRTVRLSMASLYDRQILKLACVAFVACGAVVASRHSHRKLRIGLDFLSVLATSVVLLSAIAFARDPLNGTAVDVRVLAPAYGGGVLGLGSVVLTAMVLRADLGSAQEDRTSSST